MRFSFDLKSHDTKAGDSSQLKTMPPIDLGIREELMVSLDVPVKTEISESSISQSIWKVGDYFCVGLGLCLCFGHGRLRWRRRIFEARL